MNAVVEAAVASIEQALWEMVDDLEYVIGEEMDCPSDDEAVVEDDDDNYVNPDPED